MGRKIFEISPLDGTVHLKSYPNENLLQFCYKKDAYDSKIIYSRTYCTVRFITGLLKVCSTLTHRPGVELLRNWEAPELLLYVHVQRDHSYAVNMSLK